MHLWSTYVTNRDSLLSLYPWWGMDCIPWCCWDVSIFIVRDLRFWVLGDQTHVLLSHAFQWVDIMLLVHNVSWGGCNGGDLGKGKTLPWLAPWKCISSPHHKGFWLLSSTRSCFLHQCANMVWSAKGIGGPPLVISCVLCFKQSVLITLYRDQNHFYFETCCHCNWEALLGLVFFHVSIPFSFGYASCN